MEIPTEHKKENDAVSDYNVSLSEELKRAFPLDRQCKAELIVGKSEILDIDDVSNIVQLILKARSCSWSLAYSSSIHKRTLPDFYRRLEFVSATESPLLFLIKDTEKQVRGVFIPNFHLPPGSKERGGILFHLRPHFSIFQGMTDDELLMQRTDEFMSILDKSAKCGIWLNGNLEEGKAEEYFPDSAESPQNPVQQEQQQFRIKTLECWMLSHIRT